MAGDDAPDGLSHYDSSGNARMVDVGDKDITRREAIAEGRIRMGPDALRAVVDRTAKKGDVLATAQIAGIQGAKRTSEWIPLCHPLALSSVDVVLEVHEPSSEVVCRATARVEGRTGVEMEALCAVSAALLTVYDMLKAVDRGMEIGPIHLVSKSGGRSGTWARPS